MTTTATKIPAAPATFTTDVALKSFISVSTWTATNSSFTNQLTNWIEKVDVTLVGQPDANKEPAKTMNTWATTNASAISSQNLTNELKVSSWAIVVDVTTKSVTTYNQAIYRDSSDNCFNTIDAGTALTPANANAPAIGTAGDTWAIQISTGSTYLPAAIRSGNYVTTKQALN